MVGIPQLGRAARYLEGVIFVLRRASEDHYVLESAHGSLGPLHFEDPAVNQAVFDLAVEAMPPEKKATFLQRTRELFAMRGPVESRLEISVNGSLLHVEVRAEVIEAEAGLFMAGYIRDCTETERLGAQRKTAAALAAAVRVFPDMVWLKDVDGRYVLCNEMFDRFNGVCSSELIGKTALETTEGRIAKVHEVTDRAALASKEIITYEHTVDGESGQRFFDVRKLALRDDEGNAIGILGTSRETTYWRRLESELRQSEFDYRSLADTIPDRLIRFSRDEKYLHMNRAMKEFFEKVDYPQFGALQTPDLPDRPNGPQAGKIVDALRSVIATGREQLRELEFIDRTGKQAIHEIRFFPEFAGDGEVETVLAIGRDITARKEMERRLAASEAELHALAFKDSLTGLHNRRSFQDILEVALKEAHRNKSVCALLLLDIDRFKYVNDTLGHAVGDELIVAFASRVVGAVGNAGFVCRLGGDEFAVILPALVNMESAEATARKIHAAMEVPITVSADTIAITTSIGLAFGLGHTEDQNELFRFADMALYAAKAAGRARSMLYDCSMAKSAERRFELEALINDGLRNNEFTTYFQAKVDLASGRINGVEALCRWFRPDGSLISPAEFIPLSEETGQIIEIGRRVLRDSCRFAVRVNQGRSVPIPVSVNVSARQLVFGGFLGTLGAALQETGCQTGWIELELTESLLLGDDTGIKETLDAIVALGVSLTIDDFGTGFSSLSYLARFPITALKIDQSFVRHLETDETSAVLCRAIISMAQGLGLRTVAEGIETAEIAERLKALGCCTGQGYYWNRPEPADHMLKTIAERSADLARELCAS